MSSVLPAAHRALMESRREPPTSLEFFPTPPWATRALCEVVLPQLGLPERLALNRAWVWEPACGEGHMSRVLAEYAWEVIESDVFDYGIGARVGSFVGEGLDVIARPDVAAVEWIITNPPFNLAVAFLERALREARAVAFFLRSSWADTQGRYEEVFAKTPPAAIAQFAERVPLRKGRWDPDGSTATPYAWFVWTPGAAATRFMWIPPGQREALTHPDDVRRFAKEAP